MHRVIITGINGYIGQYLYLATPSNIRTEGTVRSINPEFINSIDPQIKLHLLRLENNIFSQLEDIKTDILIHTAAIANLGVCQKNRELAEKVNAAATEEIARWCCRNQVRMIYLSTDIVFDGGNAPYAETDIPRPVNIYGSTKLRGEDAVLKHLNNAAVIRIALAMGKGGFRRTNFIDWLVDNLSNNEKTPLFIDEFRTPCPVRYLAENIWKITLSNETGIIHQAGASRLSRYDIGKMVCKLLNLSFELLNPVFVKDISDYPRPPDVSLITTRNVNGKKLILPGADKKLEELIN